MSRLRAITKVDTVPEISVFPINHLAFLSQDEIARLIDRTDRTLYPLIRSCSLAVLSSGTATDDGLGLFAKHPDFDLEFERHPARAEGDLEKCTRNSICRWRPD